MSKLKTAKAFFFAPIPIATVAVVRAIYLSNPIHWAAIFIMVAGSIYALQLIIGIPTYLLLRRYNFSSFTTFIVCGAILSPAAFLLLCLWRWDENNYTIMLLVDPLILVSIAGAVTASIFWFVARPDQDAKKLMFDNF